MKDLMTKPGYCETAPDRLDGFALHTLACEWLKQGNPVVALELLRAAIDAPETIRDSELRAKVLKETGRAYMMQSDWEKADIFYREAQQAFVLMGNVPGAAQCARNRANMSFQQGRYQESENLCEQALQWASEADDRQLRATILNTMAAIKSATGDWPEALKMFRLCLADFQATENKVRQGYVLLNIGLTQAELGENDAAIDSLNKALAIALEEKDLQLVEICYQNIAKDYLNQGEIKLAQSVLAVARKILPGLSSAALEAELNLLECRILRLSGNIETADILLKKTYDMTQAHRLTALEADVLLEQGLLARENGHASQAVAKLDAAINLYRHLGTSKGLHEAVAALEQMKRS